MNCEEVRKLMNDKESLAKIMGWEGVKTEKELSELLLLTRVTKDAKYPLEYSEKKRNKKSAELLTHLSECKECRDIWLTLAPAWKRLQKP